MFDFLKKKTSTTAPATKLKLKLSGLHCTSCSLNIDGTLEDTEGVLNSSTSYPKSETTIQYDPQRTSEPELRKVIEKLGYTTL
jgi:copper chaperone CopZ